MWPTSPSSGINSILPIANTIAGFDNPATAATALGITPLHGPGAAHKLAPCQFPSKPRGTRPWTGAAAGLTHRRFCGFRADESS